MSCYIFLDVDGVLNNKQYYTKMHKKYGGRFFCQNMPFNPRSLKNLRKLIDAVDGYVVITSSWRRNEACMAVLEARLTEYGIKIFDMTSINAGRRGEEIKEWLKDNYNIVKLNHKDTMLIIDDEKYDIVDCFDEDKYFVKTDERYGLTNRKVREAIKKVKAQPVV